MAESQKTPDAPEAAAEPRRLTATELNPKLRLLIPLVVAFAFFMEQLDSTIIVTAIPDIARSLNETPLRLNLALTAYILSLAMFIPVSGWVADKFGARNTFCAAIATFTLGSIICGAATSLPMLVFSRIFQGFGGAMMSPVGRLILLRSFPRSELIIAMSYVAIPSLIGPTMGPLAGGLITTYASWRWIFYVNIPFGILGIILAWRFVREVDVQRPPPFDWSGFFICGAGLVLMEMGIENLGHPVVPQAVTVALFVLSGLVMTFYVHYARAHANAALDLSSLRIHTFNIAVSWGAISRATMNTIPFLMPLLLQVGFGLSPIQSGSITFVSSLGSVIVRSGSARLLRWLGFDRLLKVNTILAGVSIAGFALIQPSTPHGEIVTYLLFYGILRATQFTAIQTLTFADITPVVLSRATSLSSVVQQLSQGLGISIAAAMLGLIAGPHVLTPGDFHEAFLILAGVSLLAYPGYFKLSPEDGNFVSRHRRKPAAAE